MDPNLINKKSSKLPHDYEWAKILSSNQSWAKIIFKHLPNHDKNDKLEEKTAQASQLHQPPREPTL